MKKGSMTPYETGRSILSGLAANTLGTLLRNSHVDRWGRLKGNVAGVTDILLGRWAPEAAAEL
jgi:hypothetical protein